MTMAPLLTRRKSIVLLTTTVSITILVCFALSGLFGWLYPSKDAASRLIGEYVACMTGGYRQGNRGPTEDLVFPPFLLALRARLMFRYIKVRGRTWMPLCDGERACFYGGDTTIVVDAYYSFSRLYLVDVIMEPNDGQATTNSWTATEFRRQVKKVMARD